jgi:hypothetical protein
MRLIDLANDQKWRGNLDNLERVFEVLGITGRSVQEFASHNIEAFNEVCEDARGVDYYSIGAKKGGRVMSQILSDGYDIIVNKTFGEQCDGMVRDVEARWGKYLITFENDHLEVMGF